MLNCVLIEPAFAYQDTASHSESNEDSECCFIHCSACHQWLLSQSSALPQPVWLSGDFIAASLALHYDSPAGSIFHPPLAG
jgi:hypothetical protein